MLMKWVVTFKKVHRSFQKREITSDMHSKEYHVSNGDTHLPIHGMVLAMKEGKELRLLRSLRIMVPRFLLL